MRHDRNLVLLNNNPDLYSGWQSCINGLVEYVFGVKPQSECGCMFRKRTPNDVSSLPSTPILTLIWFVKTNVAARPFSAAIRWAFITVLNSFLPTLPEPPGSPISA